MNILLIENNDFIAPNTVEITGRRFTHLTKVLKAAPGDTIKVGLLNGNIGAARVVTITDHRSTLAIELTQSPPPRLPVTLIVALPRPKVLKRVFQTIATLGVKQLHLINSYRVEKSYWQSPWLTAEKIDQNLLLGLEQGVDTQMPEVFLHRRFKPFVEDELPALLTNSKPLVAIPGDYPACPTNVQQQCTVIIGPEGGFIPYENDKLLASGCQPISLGSRILKVETAITTTLAKLF